MKITLDDFCSEAVYSAMVGFMSLLLVILSPLWLPILFIRWSKGEACDDPAV